jgi:hypothetical protein
VTDVQQASSPAAGWYPDPAGTGSTRWWSGEAWTDHVQPAAAEPAAAPSGVVPTARAEPRSQSDWHAQPARGVTVRRHGAGSVSLSTQVPSRESRRHDPYRQRNWAAGLALVLAMLGIPALGWRVVSDLPALTQSIFAGAPIAVALLALALALRRGTGLILSIVATLISGAVLLVGLLAEPAALRSIVHTVTGMLGV